MMVEIYGGCEHKQLSEYVQLKNYTVEKDEDGAVITLHGIGDNDPCVRFKISLDEYEVADFLAAWSAR